ncbi:MAG: hypothetical protein LBT32_03815 [Peptococcaceae bacterium]|nr:hypothetical protein [Peptococcaceae bacterium]
MARFILINRRYVQWLAGVVAVLAVAYTVTGLHQRSISAQHSSGTPELQMLSITLDPASQTRDMIYGDVTLKGVQIIPAQTFNLTATLQNDSAQKMTDIPIELTVSLVGNETQKTTKSGMLKSIDPGATARVTFHGIKAFGDALGKDAATGQHQIVLRVQANPSGGVHQSTEASYRFLVDSTIKKADALN